MAFIRIVCKAPPRVAPRNSLEFPNVRMIPSFHDCQVFAVDADGRELAIEGVTYVRFEVRAGEETRARLCIEGVEIDAIGQLDTTPPEREYEDG